MGQIVTPGQVAHAASHAPGGSDYVDLSTGSFAERRRTSKVSTGHILTHQSATAQASGTVYAALARAIESGAYTKLRCYLSTTVGTITEFRVGVWDSTGALILGSADVKASVVAGKVDFALGGTVNVVAGTDYYLGCASVNSVQPQMYARPLGFTGMGTDTALVSPQLIRTASGWAGGTLPALTTSGTVSWFWFDLVP